MRTDIKSVYQGDTLYYAAADLAELAGIERKSVAGAIKRLKTNGKKKLLVEDSLGRRQLTWCLNDAGVRAYGKKYGILEKLNEILSAEDKPCGAEVRAGETAPTSKVLEKLAAYEKETQGELIKQATDGTGRVSKLVKLGGILEGIRKCREFIEGGEENENQE